MSEADRLLETIAGEDEWSRHEALEELRQRGASPEWLQQLRNGLADDADATRRSAARMALAALGSPPSPAREGAQSLLRDALRSSQADLRVLAASALGEAGDPGAVGDLIRALDDHDANVAAAAADALGELGHAGAIGPLARVAAGAELWVRAGAVVALGRLRDTRALPALDESAAVPGLEVPVAEAVRRIGDPGGLAVVERLRDRAPAEALLTAGSILCSHPDVRPPDWVLDAARERLEWLRERLTSSDDPAAARLLGMTGAPAAIAELLSLAGPPRRSEAAVSGLLAVPPGPRADAILARIPAADTEECVALLALLPPLDSEERIRALIPLLSDDDAAIRAAAADSLARAPSTQALPLLTRELARSGPAPAVVRALGGLGREACGALLPLLRDPQSGVRRAAANALSRCGTPELAPRVAEALAAERDPQVRGPLLRALARLGGAAALGPLREAIDDPSPEIRLFAIEGLGATGAPEALEPLRRALDRAPPEALAAIRALGELGQSAAAPLLEPHLRSADLDRRRAAAPAAIQVAAALSPEIVERMSRDDDEWVRVCAARILARRGGADLEPLRRMADRDPAPAVRSEARRVLDADG